MKKKPLVDNKQILNIALLQISPHESTQDNLIVGLSACERARQHGADLVLFPELWQVGYQKELFISEDAINRENDFVKSFCAKARELKMAIAVTYLGKTASKPTNTVVLIDRTGTIILEYAKVHLCDFLGGSDCALSAGKDFLVAQLQYAGGTVCVGAMICFDREFPESARVLAKQGAEIIIVPNACCLAHDVELGDVRLQQIRSRAFENMVVMAVTNYPAPRYDGNSCVCAANGSFVCKAGEREEIVLGQVDVTALREWRQKEVWVADKNSMWFK